MLLLEKKARKSAQKANFTMSFNIIEKLIEYYSRYGENSKQ